MAPQLLRIPTRGTLQTLMNSPRWTDLPPLLVGVLAVSTGAIFIKLCQAHPLTVGAYRLTLALPLIWFWAERVEAKWWRRVAGSEGKWLCLSGVLLGLHFAFWVASLSFTTVTSSVVLVTTNPLFVGLGSVIFLKEKVSKRLWQAIVLAVLGSTLVALGSPAEAQTATAPMVGNLLALLGAVCMSGYLLVGRKMSANIPTPCYVAAVYTVAAATLWAGVLVSGAPRWGFTTHQWLLLFGMAFIPQGVGHTLINKSLKVLPTAVVAVAILGEPIFSTLLAIPLVGELPTLLQIVGGAVVIGAVALSSLGSKKRTV